MKAMSKVIHIGLSTHHQDHAINPSSLRAINKIVNAPLKPSPELVLWFSILLAISMFLIRYLLKINQVIPLAHSIRYSMFP